ncbi:hypothetical protein Syn7803US50_159 [Synechococcus phage ACG-2014f]|uniref:Uncharacterized protein n=1 Tax=Synechococcus phage ACG-2014f TaxID=1493511 RepID=A0A0E3FQY1_9CAUD|nr:hypothetical protein Syn7803US42_161 [Synechococcus phage ACG-2014f]AIX33143.1 hypothetical protein Syn7803US50_159 [Synechococcus phage ACG-2014f]
MNVKLIRMNSGEDVIADLISETGDTLVLSNPIVLVPGQGGTLGFAPWSPVISPDVKEITIRANYVVFMSEPNEDVVDNYNQIFSPIVTPSSKGLIL